MSPPVERTADRHRSRSSRSTVVKVVPTFVLVAALTGACGGVGTQSPQAGRAQQGQAGTPHADNALVSPSTASTGAAPRAVTPTTTPPSTTTGQAGKAADFEGIYEFAGQNSSTDATDPDLAGVVLDYYWSQIEPTRGSFDWGLIDQDMAPWIAAGKKVILRIATSGAAGWAPPYSGNGTPAWVYADGTRAIHDNGETLPVYWDAAYLDDYHAFVTSFGEEFDGDPHVTVIEPGIGMGGETLPETDPSAAGVAAWQADGYTDTLWLSTVERIASFFETPFARTPVYPLVDMTFFDGNYADENQLVRWFAAVPGWGLQYDGLDATHRLGAAWSGRPLALEQRVATRQSGDCLCADIDNGLDTLHARYLLIYASDIDDPANATELAATEARVGSTG